MIITTEEITKEMLGELGPLKVENVIGRAEVKEVFKSGKKDKAAGLPWSKAIRKGVHARLTDDVIVSATTIASLRRFKDDVDEVRWVSNAVSYWRIRTTSAGDQLKCSR